MYFMQSLIYAQAMAEVCAPSVFEGHRLSHSPLLFFFLGRTCRICSTDQMGILELVHGAFKEAGFLADDRPLEVCPGPDYICIIPRDPKKHPFSLIFSSSLWHDVFNCITHFSTRHTISQSPLNAAAPIPQIVYLSFSRRFRGPQVMARMTLAYGPWTICEMGCRIRNQVGFCGAFIPSQG